MILKNKKAKAAIGSIVFLSLFFLLVFIPSVESADVSTCQNITSPGVYTLTTDINEPTVSKCFWIQSGDVWIDGAGKTLNASTDLIYSDAGSLDNITIKNIVMSDEAVSNTIRFLNTTAGNKYTNLVLQNNTITGAVSFTPDNFAMSENWTIKGNLFNATINNAFLTTDVNITNFLIDSNVFVRSEGLTDSIDIGGSTTIKLNVTFTNNNFTMENIGSGTGNSFVDLNTFENATISANRFIMRNLTTSTSFTKLFKFFRFRGLTTFNDNFINMSGLSSKFGHVLIDALNSGDLDEDWSINNNSFYFNDIESLDGGDNYDFIELDPDTATFSDNLFYIDGMRNSTSFMTLQYDGSLVTFQNNQWVINNYDGASFFKIDLNSPSADLDFTDEKLNTSNIDTVLFNAIDGADITIRRLIWNSSLDSGTFALGSDVSADYAFYDSNFTTAIPTLFNATSNTDFNLFNISYVKVAATEDISDGTLIRFWHLDSNVTDDLIVPLEAATVTSRTASGASDASGSTNANGGLASTVFWRDYSTIDNVETDQDLHKINVTKTGYITNSTTGLNATILINYRHRAIMVPDPDSDPIVSWVNPTPADDLSTDNLNVTFNITSHINIDTSILQLTNSTGAANYTMTKSATNRIANYSFIDLPIENYTYLVIVNNSNGNTTVTSSRSLNLTGPDTIVPSVTINFPTATTYGSTDLPFNFNVSLNEEGSVMYSLDGGANNISMANSTGGGAVGRFFNATNASIADGTYTFSVYANDSIGNNNYTENVTFTLDTSVAQQPGGGGGGGTPTTTTTTNTSIKLAALDVDFTDDWVPGIEYDIYATTTDLNGSRIDPTDISIELLSDVNNVAGDISRRREGSYQRTYIISTDEEPKVIEFIVLASESGKTLNKTFEVNLLEPTSTNEAIAKLGNKFKRLMKYLGERPLWVIGGIFGVILVLFLIQLAFFDNKLLKAFKS